ncbi:hypothetical protein DPMN_051063, partial [Dreissena polymorpha]
WASPGVFTDFLLYKRSRLPTQPNKMSWYKEFVAYLRELDKDTPFHLTGISRVSHGKAQACVPTTLPTMERFSASVETSPYVVTQLAEQDFL